MNGNEHLLAERFRRSSAAASRLLAATGLVARLLPLAATMGATLLCACGPGGDDLPTGGRDSVASDIRSDLDGSIVDVDAESGPPVTVLRPAQRIAAGFWHSCYAAETGVACWGMNNDPWGYDTLQGTVPNELVLSQVDAGDFHTCGVTRDGQAACWGDNRDGQCLPVDGEYQWVAAGAGLSCGLRVDGGIACWGRFADELDIPADKDFVQVAVARTWDNYNGVDACGLHADGRVECWSSGGLNEAFAPPGDERFVQISLGVGFGCGITVGQTLQCWSCAYLACRAYDEGQTDAPSGTFTQVSAGGLHACAIATTGETLCWGISTETGRTEPPDASFVEIDVGNYNACGVTSDGDVLCWGDNSARQSSPPGGL